MAILRAVGLLILLFLASPVAAQNHALMVDNSGSMKPYYEAQLIQDLGQAIEGVMKKHGEAHLLAFSTDVAKAPSLQAIASQPFGNYTYLDRAIDFAITNNYSIAWILTDNIEHQPGTAEAGNTEVFYRKLRSDAVKQLNILPLLQPAGRGGLIIYAILLSPDAKEAYEKEIAGFLADVRGVYKTEALRMKPLDRDTLDINFVRSNLQPNKSTVVYKEGQDVREVVDVRFKSKFEHLKIVDAKVGATQAKPEFDPSSLLRPEKKDIAVSPERVTALDPQAETDEIYQVKIDLGKVKLKKDIASLWKAAWGNSGEEVSLNLALFIEVPQENFKFKDKFLNTYSAKTPELASTTGKIYGIETLPMLLGESTTSIGIEKTLAFRVEYPWWPAVMWIGLFLAACVACVALSIMVMKGGRSLFARSDKWDVTARTERGAALDCALDEQGIVRVGGDEIGLISKNRFLPSANSTIEGGGDTANIEEGLQLKVQAKGRPIVLVFRKPAPEQGQEQLSYTPEKR